MTLSDLASLGSLVSGIAVLLTLVFLLIQTRQNAVALARAEANANQTAASIFRMAIVNDKDVARVVIAAVAEKGELDQIDTLRFQMLLFEMVWFSVLLWQQQQVGIAPKGAWERSHRVLDILVTRRGAVWWDQSKAGFPPGFTKDVDKAIAAQQISAPRLGPS